MAYQVLARKWRPQSFEEVVGQEPIVTALRNALNEGKIAQAYLFSGIRGVGKTSVARILAKALNCERGTEGGPCNECAICRQISQGSDMDVLEVDAATYSKVEQIRDLTESLRYGPARDRYKVVVLDEVHRLSRQAFDALLKIIEEPPSHLVFIFATTEIESVPATILSRCQEYNFRRVGQGPLTELLARIAASEGIEISDKVVRLLARAGEGSVRDAVALMDQMATYGGGAVSDTDANRVLGGADATLQLRLLSALLEGRSDEVSSVVSGLEEMGRDPRHVFGDFLTYCRDALHLSLGWDPDDVDLPDDDASDLARAAADAGYENLLRLLHQLLRSEEAVRRSEAGTLALEVAWLRAAELPKLRRLEDLLAGVPPTGSESGGSQPEESGGAQQETRSQERESSPEPAPPTAVDPPPPPAGRPEAAGPSPLPVDKAESATIAAFLDQVSRRKQPLAAHLSEAQKLELQAGRLLIYSQPGDDWLAKALARGNNLQLLEDSLAEVCGSESTVELREGRIPRSVEAPAPEVHPAASHPTVQAALDIFGGRVERIDEPETSGEGDGR